MSQVVFIKFKDALPINSIIRDRMRLTSTEDVSNLLNVIKNGPRLSKDIWRTIAGKVVHPIVVDCTDEYQRQILPWLRWWMNNPEAQKLNPLRVANEGLKLLYSSSMRFGRIIQNYTSGQYGQEYQSAGFAPIDSIQGKVHRNCDILLGIGIKPGTQLPKITITVFNNICQKWSFDLDPSKNVTLPYHEADFEWNTKALTDNSFNKQINLYTFKEIDFLPLISLQYLYIEYKIEGTDNISGIGFVYGFLTNNARRYMAQYDQIIVPGKFWTQNGYFRDRTNGQCQFENNNAM